MSDDALPPADLALVRFLEALDARGYDFVPPTPLSHQRVLKRPKRQAAQTVRDVFGWSLPFVPDVLGRELLQLLRPAGVLRRDGDRLASDIRVSRLHGRLFIHSAFPTEAEDAVFLGPDSYRFADLIVRETPPDLRGRVVDVGGGAGVGALTAAGAAPQAQITVTDVNPKALRFARINAAHAGVRLETRETSALEGVEPGLALALANPPYIGGSKDQTYQDGGGMHGGRVSLEWARAAVERLAPGGRLILYTGSAVLDGGYDRLHEALHELASASGCGFDYRELDPDVFGEELETEAYRDVERIAVVACVIARPT